MHSTGMKIRFFRKKKRITQKQLAKMLGISQAELSRMECNRTPITVNDLHKISAILGVRTIDFINDQPHSN